MRVANEPLQTLMAVFDVSLVMSLGQTVRVKQKTIALLEFDPSLQLISAGKCSQFLHISRLFGEPSDNIPKDVERVFDFSGSVVAAE